MARFAPWRVGALDLSRANGDELGDRRARRRWHRLVGSTAPPNRRSIEGPAAGAREAAFPPAAAAAVPGPRSARCRAVFSTGAFSRRTCRATASRASFIGSCDHGWHWIPTIDARMNTRGCGFEWMAAPFLLIMHSERFVFVLTTLSFCLLPAVTFLLFRELGVRARAAWAWAWVLPTSYCFLFQAGTLCTDIVGAVFAMAAVALALRARREKSFALFFYSVLSAALMTNQKASNLPLLLPIVVAWGMNLPTLRQQWVRTSLALLLGLTVSFLPLAVENRIHTGGFTGLDAETTIYRPAPPAVALAANAVLVTAYALTPPLLTPRGPGANVFEFFHSPALMDFLRRNFEGRYGMLPKVTDEDLGGLGLGVTVLLLWRLGVRTRGARAPELPGALDRRLVRIASDRVARPVREVDSLCPASRAGRLLSAGAHELSPGPGRGPHGASARMATGGGAAFPALPGLFCLLTSTPIWPLRLAPFLERRLGQQRFLRPLFETYGTNPRMQSFYTALPPPACPRRSPSLDCCGTRDETELYYSGSDRLARNRACPTR